jgi:hypothetical protein
MRRRLLTLATLGSLLLCLAALAAWAGYAWSGGGPAAPRVPRRSGAATGLYAHFDGVHLERFRPIPPVRGPDLRRPAALPAWLQQVCPEQGHVAAAGFVLGRGAQVAFVPEFRPILPGSAELVEVDVPECRGVVAFLVVPYWAVAVAAAVLPAGWAAAAWRRRRRQRAGRCPACGYDLRATPERCPECGVAVSEGPAETFA